MQYVILDTLESALEFINYIKDSKQSISTYTSTDGKILESSQYNALVPAPIYNLIEKHIPKMCKKKDYKILTKEYEIDVLLKYLENKEIIAYDIETTGLKHYSDKVIGISICAEQGVAFYIPHLTWEEDMLQQILSSRILKRVLEVLKTKKLIMWNGSFDVRLTKQYFGVDLTDSLYSDSMLLKHTVAEEGEFSLKGCAILYQDQLGLDMEKAANEEQIELKANVASNGGSTTKNNFEMYKADLEVLGKYAASDADLTLRLFELLSKSLKEEKLEKLYYNEEVMPLYKKVTIPMESNPVKLDIPLILKTKEDIERDIKIIEEDIYSELQSYPEFNEYLKDMLQEKVEVSNKGFFAECVLNYFNFKTITGKSGKVSITKKYIDSLEESEVKSFLKGEGVLSEEDLYEIRKLFWETKNGKFINISSKAQLGKFAFEYLNIEPLSKTDKGSPQFNDELINSLDMKWAELLRDYNKLEKIKSTYIERFLDNQVDGNYYFYYKQHGTLSGRYSSDAQQLPRPKEDGELSPIVLHYNNLVRSFFIAGEGRKFIDADYESLEPHCFSEVAGDEGLKNIFRQGHDFYSTIAIRTEKLNDFSPDKKAPNYLGKLAKPKRQVAKAYSLGVPYGMTPYALALSINVSQEEAQKLYDGYLDGFPELKKWMERSKSQVQRTGVIRTSTGRVRHLPKVKEIYEKYKDDLLDFKYRNSLIYKLKNKLPDSKSYVTGLYLDYKNGINNSRNFQIQGLAASIVNRAMIAIMDSFKENNIDGWVCATIHDQIICNVADKDVEAATKIVKYCMENTTKLSIDLKAPPAIGNNWKDTH